MKLALNVPPTLLVFGLFFAPESQVAASAAALPQGSRAQQGPQHEYKEFTPKPYVVPAEARDAEYMRRLQEAFADNERPFLDRLRIANKYSYLRHFHDALRHEEALRKKADEKLEVLEKKIVEDREWGNDVSALEAELVERRWARQVVEAGGYVEARQANEVALREASRKKLGRNKAGPATFQFERTTFATEADMIDFRKHRLRTKVLNEAAQIVHALDKENDFRQKNFILGTRELQQTHYPILTVFAAQLPEVYASFDVQIALKLDKGEWLPAHKRFKIRDEEKTRKQVTADVQRYFVVFIEHIAQVLRGSAKNVSPAELLELKACVKRINALLLVLKSDRLLEAQPEFDALWEWVMAVEP